MTQKDKELLLKDLCARLPYGVKILHRDCIHLIKCISPTGEFQNYDYDAWFDISTIKPYLRPMSSMSEEEHKEYNSFSLGEDWVSNKYMAVPAFDTLDWLNAHHFDYRGLIEKGIALKASEGMY